MHPVSDRRRLVMSTLSLSSLLPAGRAGGGPAAERPTTLYTFGDSILDCAAYNAHGVHPGQLLVRNDDPLFPDFSGRDLQSLAGPARLMHRAANGATAAGLPAQASEDSGQADTAPGRRVGRRRTVGAGVRQAPAFAAGRGPRVCRSISGGTETGTVGDPVPFFHFYRREHHGHGKQRRRERLERPD